MKLVILSWLFVMVLSTTAQEDKRIRCGDELVKTRKLLCEAENAVKRKAPLQYDMETEVAMLPQRRYWSGRNGGSVRWKRDYDGIADECCLNPCTLDDIRAYC